MLQRQIDIADRFRFELNKTRPTANQISFIGVQQNTVVVGLEDVTDEKLKAEILALSGIEKELIEFTEFRID